MMISIHALLAESDCPLFFSCWLLAYFYPRSPCGERQIPNQRKIDQQNFYPRSPCGERRWTLQNHHDTSPISIHALLAESDLAGPSGPAFLFNFYPRSPCGERRLLLCCDASESRYFYPRSPCGERRCTHQPECPVI